MAYNDIGFTRRVSEYYEGMQNDPRKLPRDMPTVDPSKLDQHTNVDDIRKNRRLTRRAEAWRAIQGERDYQDTKWPGHADRHEVEAYLLYMQHHLNRAIAAVSAEEGTLNARHEVRKILALGIAMFEEFECPERAK